MRDELAMRRAQALADAARRHTPPWPWVGCVIVQDGLVVGEGATGPYPTGPHAERAALASVAGEANGATVYVTLEPCDHHGNTPPCTDALLDAGVERVVVALRDPDANVDGRGLERLRAHGVRVDVGEGEEAALRSLRPYLHHRRTGRPFSMLKIAMTLDARVAAADGTSRWITGEAARIDVHRLRSECQAILVGANTALVDRPSLTVRDAPLPPRQPLRVLLDAAGRVPPDGPLFDSSLASTVVLTTECVPSAVRSGWEAAGAEVAVLPDDAAGLAPHGVLEYLASRGVIQTMLEGGSTLHGAFLSAQAVDQVVAYVAPMFLGLDGRLGWGVPGPATIEDATRFRLEDVTRIGDDVRIVASLREGDV